MRGLNGISWTEDSLTIADKPNTAALEYLLRSYMRFMMNKAIQSTKSD